MSDRSRILLRLPRNIPPEGAGPSDLTESQTNQPTTFEEAEASAEALSPSASAPPEGAEREGLPRRQATSARRLMKLLNMCRQVPISQPRLLPRPPHQSA
mmetsp:Transcript_2008/g.6319  ORF Transcript_2008/g.6319 Transcript_2008/m.6319 type:complete len:100 (+) Transcript_2008:31-330(+)